MPLTNLGYERPLYEDLLEAQIAKAKLLFGEDIDTNDNTPLGKYIRLNVKDLADLYEVAEKVYYARFPNTATGVSLDRLCTFVGVARHPAIYAQHNIRFIGTAGEYVPEGFEVSIADGSVIFHTYDSLLIGEDGTVDGIVYCEEAGVIGNVAVGKINTIVKPNVNVESIEHLSMKLEGENRETDAELRVRFHATVSSSGAATETAIKGAILKVPMVEGAEVVGNDTDETVNGIPPHSFECYVLSPESQDVLVAEAIFSKKPIGIKAVGDVSVEVIDESGVSHNVSFSRTIRKNIYIKIAIGTNNFYETDGAAQIKNDIAQYINALKNGEDVFLSSLYGYIFKTTGVVNVSSLTMSSDGSTYSTNDIAINPDEVARISTANIEVVVS